MLVYPIIKIITQLIADFLISPIILFIYWQISHQLIHYFKTMYYSDKIKVNTPPYGKVIGIVNSFLQIISRQTSNFATEILPLATYSIPSFALVFQNLITTITKNLFRSKREQAKMYIRQQPIIEEQQEKAKEYMKLVTATRQTIIYSIDTYIEDKLQSVNQDYQTNMEELINSLNDICRIINKLTKQKVMTNNYQKQTSELFHPIRNIQDYIYDFSNQILDHNIMVINQNYLGKDYLQFKQVPTKPSNSQSLLQDILENQGQDIIQDIFQDMISGQNVPNQSEAINLKQQNQNDHLKSKKEYIQPNISMHNPLVIPNQLQIVNKTERQNIVKQILHIKNKLSHLKLFKKDKQFFKMCFKEDLDIKKIVYSCSKKQFQKIQLKVFKLKSKLEQMIFNIEQTCKKHLKKVQYMCLNQYLKQQIYLCSLCISLIQVNNKHCNHEIICKYHKKTINHQIMKNQKQKNLQQKIFAEHLGDRQFVCQQCIRDIPTTDKLEILEISQCHYVPFIYICIDESCIINNQFKICPVCQSSKHQNHRVIRFSKQSLMNQFYIQNQSSISQFQQLYIDIRERLKLHPIKKTIDSFAKQLWQGIKFLQSFLIGNNKQIQKWVDCVINERSMEEMYVLWGVSHLKYKNYQDKQKLCFLQVFNDLIKVELQKLFTIVSHQLNNFQSKIKAFININDLQIQHHLNKKYQKVINIENNVQIVNLPCNLSQINLFHNNRIQYIQICKGNDDETIERIQNRSQNRRIRFYNFYIWQLFKQANLSQKIQHIIFNSLIQSQNLIEWKNHTLQKIKVPLQQEQSLKEFKSLLSTSWHMLRQLEQKNYQCPPLQYIIMQKFTSLKVLRIEYSINQQSQCQNQLFKNSQYFYSISAFDLFQIISQNKQLEQASIKGIQIKYLKKFIQFFRQSSKQSLTSQLLMDNRMISSQQISNLQKSGKIALSLCAVLYFSANSNTNDLQEQIQDLHFFCSSFDSISDLTVQISFDSCLMQLNLEHLANQLRKIKRLKLSLHDAYSTPPSTILIYLINTNFLHTQSLQDSEFDFSKIKGIQSQQLLNKLFKNNGIIHLQLYECKQLPKLPLINTLETIQISNHRTKQLSQFINNLIRQNKQIKKMRIQDTLRSQNEPLNLYDLKNIQVLILQTNGVNDRVLFSLHCQNIKHLQLANFQSSISSKSLRIIFPKLVNLTSLYLWRINCRGEIILMIPSLLLRTLRLNMNNQITNLCLQAIDSKWPYIKRLTVQYCQMIDVRMFSLCKFRSLIQLVIDNRMIQESRSVLAYMKKRGIQVFYI